MDRVQITTEDDQAAIAALQERFDIAAAIREGMVSMAVADGAAFVPRLFDQLGVAIRSVTVTRPSLDDVFLAHTGITIRDAESSRGAMRPMSALAWRR
jgi:ABC-2 type transport system ATP-binding protein